MTPADALDTLAATTQTSIPELAGARL